MYEIEEFYAVDGLDLKEVLKSCIFNYYIKYKDEKDTEKELQKNKNHRIMDATNKDEILSKEGVKYVQTVQ